MNGYVLTGGAFVMQGLTLLLGKESQAWGSMLAAAFLLHIMAIAVHTRGQGKV